MQKNSRQLMQETAEQKTGGKRQQKIRQVIQGTTETLTPNAEHEAGMH